MNYTNTAINHIDGYSGNNITGNSSNYILESSSNDSATTLASAVVSNAIHFVQNAFNSTRKYDGNATDDKNINVTDAELHDFVLKLLEYNQFNLSTDNESVACEHYCNGFVKDVFSNYKRMHGYISLAICIFGTIANILNIIVLTRKDMSKTPINTILKWLAVADMFLMIEYIPFSIHMYIGPRPVGFKYLWSVYILFHMHFTQILHTISISLTVILALWRYIAIKHPHGRLASCVLSHCGAAILLSFLLAPILCLPTYFVFRINEKVIFSDKITKVTVYHVDTKQDTILYSINFWLFSVIIKLLPCLVLTVISFILIRVLYQAAKRKVKLKGYNQAASTSNINTVKILNGHRPSKCQRRTDRTTMLLVAVLMLFLITEFPQGILGLLSGLLETCFFRKCYIPFGEMMDLLALINAAVGFVLYGLMSKQFRTSFKSVFFNKRLSRLEMTRVTNLNNTTCV
ncbi:sex peptide receptor [Contarinia nasturtii]|uniref:sex peptide receptor n=1 Tax=Contarinia nasturtii TaxID=265458 RepID=UPI0012D38260|nr:sex peptide receptor [Contarinia nasturtii]XP_031640944.1 sex peptide receptor [Contarinia nasturtii]XP_031640945.1 sex peptide receptor [Contarinia nasturtii]